MKFIRKIAACLAAGVMAAAALTTAASAASITSATKSYDSGQAFTIKLQKDKKDFDYKIKLAKGGDLKITYKGSSSNNRVYLVDSDGANIKASDKSSEAKSGNVYTYSDYTLFSWNSDTELASGTIVYKNLDKGTYYIRISHETWSNNYSGTGKTTFRFTYPQGSSDSDSSKLTAIQIPLKKGASMQLTAVDGATWTTSDKAVVSVSSSGKITANKAGTATITAKAGGSSAQIIVKVS